MNKNTLINAITRQNNFVIYSFLLGLLSSLALPPINCIIVLPIAFSLMLELIFNAPYKRRFLLGYSFGVGHFVLSLSWIGNALLVEADKFAWLQPIALLLIPAVLAIYIGLCCMLTAFVKQNRLCMWLTFSTTWVCLELIRSWFLIPFPWNLIGYSALYSIELSQFAAVVGIYGLSFVIMLFSSVFFTRSWCAILMMIASMLLITFWGSYRISSANQQQTGLTVRIVQPSFAEHHLGNQAIRINHIKTLVEVSNRSSDITLDVIIWPEAVLSLYMDDDLLLKTIERNLGNKSWLVSGVDRVDTADKYYNSIVSSNPQGDLVSFYDKHMLVAFGEYIPLRFMMPNVIEKIAYGMGDFTVGGEYHLLDVGPKTKAIPLICYEAAFSGLVSRFPINDASLLVNVTNDFWFGDSFGPYQHLAIAKFRAIEYGKPLVRAVNNGISAAVDLYGRELGSIPLNERGYLDVKLPDENIKTIYSQYLDLLPGLLYMLLLICYSIGRNKKVE